MEAVETNKGFISEMLRGKKRLGDYPDRVDPDIVIHEPASLPFGGTYRGLREFERLLPALTSFYDFSRFELLKVYAEGDSVFAEVRVGLAQSPSSLRVLEHFRFTGTRLTEIRAYVFDSQEARLDGARCQTPPPLKR